MWRDAFLTVHEIALDQHGYITTDQAAAGVAGASIRMMARRGATQTINSLIQHIDAAV